MNADPIEVLRRSANRFLERHYLRPVNQAVGEPSLAEVLYALESECYEPMLAVLGQADQVIGYQCPKCGTTASVSGQTEHGPTEEP